MRLANNSLTRPIRRFVAGGILAGFAMVLAGCDQSANNDTPVEVVDLGDATQSTAEPVTSAAEAAVTASTQATTAQPVAADVPADEVKEGQYLLETDVGKVMLRAVKASRFAIIEDLAKRTGFELIVGAVPDRLVSVEVEGVTQGSALESILQDTAFQASYRPGPGVNGYRLARVTVGEQAVAADGSQQSSASASRPVVYEPEDTPVFLGSEPEDIELVQRLLGGSEEERVDAVNELVLDPAGLNAAYQVYRNDSSAEVRLAIVEVMEGEETFAARQLMIEALDDPSPEVALYALGVVDSNSDFSLLPKVRNLMQHPDPEVAEYAREIEESIRLSYEDTE